MRMPELPELEVLKDNLNTHLAGKKLAGIRFYHPAVLKRYFPRLDSVAGRRLSRIERRGKWLIFVFEPRLYMAVHLMLEGRFSYNEVSRGQGLKIGRDLSLRISFADGSALLLYQIGPKKLSKVYLVEDLNTIPELRMGGIEPLSPEFSPQQLVDRLKRDRLKLKRFLTDQRILVGIGNAYSDEILFKARLSPLKLSTSLTEEEVKRLFLAIKEVLGQAIEAIKSRVGDGFFKKEPRDFFSVHGRAGERCKICGSRIAEIRYRDGSTYYCPGCQTQGKVLSVRRRSFLR